MNKLTIKKLPFKLLGETITKDNELHFTATNKDGTPFDSSNLKGKVIISIFPAMNTRVCDAQTQAIAKLAMKHKDIHFLSITTDSLEVINKWCAAHGVNNINIVSDTELSFAKATNIYIPKIKKLGRGFILFEEGTIIDIVLNKEISADPDFDKLEGWLSS